MNKIIIRISLFLSCIYLIIRFIDNMFLAQANLGDESFFFRDLNYFLNNSYAPSVINGISIPITLFSSLIYYFLNDISMSLRFANAIIVFALILYVFFRKDLLAPDYRHTFIIHLFLLIGTTSGMFYGTNDSFFAVSFFIICSECYLYLKINRINKILLIIAYAICVLSRPHFIIYIPILFLSLFAFLTYSDGLNMKIIRNPIIINFFIGLCIALIFNYPKIMNAEFSHNQGSYLPKFLFLSYADKSGTYKTDDPGFSWTQWHYYSQMVANKKGLGLFAPMVNWDEVKKYKEENGKNSLPSSYQQYLIEYSSSVLKRLPVSIIEISLMSIRYLGIFLFILPFWLIFQIKHKTNNPSIFISVLVFVGIFTWAFIWPRTVVVRWLASIYIMLLILVTDKSNFNSYVFNNNYLVLNIIIMDIITIWALLKWKIFYHI